MSKAHASGKGADVAEATTQAEAEVPAEPKPSAAKTASAVPGPVTLGGVEFKDRTALWHYTRALRDSLDRDSEVVGKPLRVLMALLDFHPKADQKRGSGIDRIVYSEHATYTGTMCFNIHRTDGTTEDFSFRKCINAIFGEAAGKKGVGSSTGVAAKRKKRERVPGCMVRASGLPVGTHFADVKDAMAQFGEVGFVRMDIDGTTAVATFSQAPMATCAANTFKHFKGKRIESAVLTPDEERAYFKQQAANKRLRASEPQEKTIKQQMKVRTLAEIEAETKST